MTTIEHRELKGITVRNLIVTIASTASIVASVITTYFQLRADIRDVSAKQEAQARVDEVRLKVLEDQVAILQQQVDGIKSQKATINQPKPYPTFTAYPTHYSPLTIHSITNSLIH
jgi:hypothetical protein